MAQEFQGGDDLYKQGKQAQDPKQLAEIVKRYQDLIKANKALDKATLKQSKALDVQGKNLERLEKRLISLRTKAVDPVEKALGSLTTRLTGGNGLNSALTKFAGTSASSLFNVDKLNDKVSVFGRTLNISATAFMRYLGVFQLVIAATLKYLDFQDEAQRRQGRLMKAFGDTNVSIATSYRTAAEGWRVAGSAGAETAKKLNEAIFKSRGGTAMSAGVEGEMQGYRKLLTMSAGFSGQVPAWITKLSETFAVRDEKTVINQIEQLGALAQQSGAPLEQMTNMVFDLAQQFVGLGASVDDAQGMVAEFVDAVGQGKISAVIGLELATQAMGERRTGAGVSGMAKTAWAIANQFDKLPEAVKKSLGEGFATKDIGAQMGILQRMTDAEYQAAKMTAVYEQLAEIEKGGGGKSTMGEQAAKVAAQEWGVEWFSLQKAIEAVGYGETSEGEFAKKFQEALEKQKEALKEGMDVPKTAGEVVADKLADFQIFYKESAKTQAEWYSKIWAEVAEFKGSFIAWTSRGRSDSDRRIDKKVSEVEVLAETMGYDDMSPAEREAFQLEHVEPVKAFIKRQLSSRGVDLPSSEPYAPTTPNRWDPDYSTRVPKVRTQTIRVGEDKFDVKVVIQPEAGGGGQQSRAVTPKLASDFAEH